MLQLTIPVKLTDFGAASPSALPPTKEEERAAALVRRAQQGDYDEGIPTSLCIRLYYFQIADRVLRSSYIELINEQLTRTSSFLTPSRLSELRSSFVIVVGLGGVGSHCTAALVRSGVSKIRLIDFDQVTLSSLNRHAVATLADVGTPKVQCMRKRLEGVVPWVRWECLNQVWREDQAARLLRPWDQGVGRKVDYVVDAIDNIDSKVALLKYCYDHSIKVISSMGAGCKSDPSKICVGDISTSVEDPLSKSTRRRLRAVGITEGVPVVFSTEKPGPGKAQLLPLPEEEFQKGKVGELGVLPDFRVRILPVLGTMPALFGQAVANFVMLEITGYPHEVGGGKAREKMYDGILGALQGLEERLARTEGEANAVGLRLPITKDDVGYLVEEVYKGKSVVSGLPTRLALIRWRAPNGGFGPDTRWRGQIWSRMELKELACMTKDEAAAHEREILRGGKRPEEVYDDQVIQLVDRRMAEELAFERYR